MGGGGFIDGVATPCPDKFNYFVQTILYNSRITVRCSSLFCPIKVDNIRNVRYMYQECNTVLQVIIILCLVCSIALANWLGVCLPHNVAYCFCSIISNSIQLLVQDMENACVSSFSAMVKVRVSLHMRFSVVGHVTCM